jgi:formylglycine-generating enzyme required for sulfatase activity
MRKPPPCLLLLLAAGACAPRPVTLAEHLGLPPLDMVPVEGGQFEMGDVFARADEDATPVHPVTVAGFRIGRTEVTAEHYARFAEATGRPYTPHPSGGRPPSYPSVGVTWDDAVAFCAAYGYRLPTEAEWEYAARAGGRALRYAGTSAADSLGLFAWVRDNTAPGPFPVAQKQPNTLGLYDLSGNAAEWVGAFYEFYPAPGTAPAWQNLETRDMRITRGGSVYGDPEMAQTFRRAATLRDLSASDLGFRCAADAG